MDGLTEVKLGGERGEIVGVVIHVVPVSGLGRSPMTAPVMSNDAIALIEKEEHLSVPVVGGKRPAVTKYDRLTLAPILVVNLRAVSRGNS